MAHEDLEVCLYLLVHALCLAIGLQVVGGGGVSLTPRRAVSLREKLDMKADLQSLITSSGSL